MPCIICNAQNEEKICSGCSDYFKSLKCEYCSNAISLEQKNFHIFCNICGTKNVEDIIKEKTEKLEKEREEIKDNEKKRKEIEKELREIALLSNKPVYDDKKFIDFYDIILKINSIRDVLNGWNIEFSENGKEYYEKMKTKDYLKVGVVGLGNKGKSFLLQKLANIELPSGSSIKTEGLSIKCPDINSESKNIILIDSAGSETPLVEDANFDFNKFKDNPEDLRDQLDNLARDKCLTESFLQSIIINESNMLLILVGNLTYPEQKLLNKIRKETQNRKQNLYVIHNLQNFTERSQVERYIEETLLKSATFRLKKNKEISIDNPEGNDTQNDSYFIEESFVPKAEDNNIFHLIMAREKTNAGQYYNNFVIKFLRNQMNNFPKQYPFPIVKKVKDYFFHSSKDYLETPLAENAFEESEDVIKLKKDTELKLKKVLVDEMGISNFIGNAYSPKMCYFIFKNKFYFQIELPGKFDKKSFKYNIFVKDKYYIFDIKATKIIGSKPFFPKELSDRKFSNSREEGPFQIRFNILAEDFQFKTLEIKQVKAPKKPVEKTKIDYKIANNSKETKKGETGKSLELDDVKSEEGVLTFYVELQITKSEEKGLSDSEDEDE